MLQTKRFRVFLIIALVLLSGDVFADYIERECALIAEKVELVCGQSFPESRPAIAVIPFTSRITDLKQRHIGFGVSELLTSALVTKSTFIVLERNQIEKVLGEQKLSLTGLTADSALKVGKLLGAKLIVTGTVDKISENYRINCRLVSAENGTVLASHLADFRIDEFEKKAQKNIIPKKEAIGVYAGWRLIPVSQAANSSVMAAGNTYSDARILSNILSLSICAGSRFYLMDNLVVDLSFSGSHFTYSMEVSGSAPLARTVRESNGCANLMLTASWALALNPGMDVFLGTGIEYFVKVSPLVAAGFEWRPWQRVGATLWVYYRLSTNIYSLNTVQGNSIPPLPIFRLDPISIMPAFSFYF